MTAKFVLFATIVVALSAASTAAAKLPAKGQIKEGVGVAGVNLGMTEKAALKQWGKPEKPDRCVKVAGTPFRHCTWSRIIGPNQSNAVSILTRGGKVVHIKVYGPGLKTTKGIATGASLELLKRRYKKLKFAQTCVQDRGYVAETGGGRAVTQFRFTRKDAALDGRATVDAIVLYNPKKVGWDGDSVLGRPQNRSSCAGQGFSDPADSPPPPPPPPPSDPVRDNDQYDPGQDPDPPADDTDAPAEGNEA